jgi:hypothetical protein
MSYPFDRKCSRRSRHSPRNWRFGVYRTTHRTIRVFDRWDDTKWDIPFEQAIHIDFDVRKWYMQQRIEKYGVPLYFSVREFYNDNFDPELFAHHLDDGYEVYFTSMWFDEEPIDNQPIARTCESGTVCSQPAGNTHTLPTGEPNSNTLQLALLLVLYQLLRQEYRRSRRARVDDAPETDVQLNSIFLGASRLTQEPSHTLARNAAMAKDYNRLVPPPIVITIQIDGKEARTLLDTGSLGDFMSTRFADQMKNRRVPLTKPLPVSLAVTGSRTMANYCVDARLQYGGINSVRHFDIINLDNYDIILGTPFLYQHRVQHGFNDSRVHIGSAEPLPLRGERISKVSSRLMDLVETDIERCSKHVQDYARSLQLFQTAAEAPFPPLRAINHEIPLIDESKIYHYRRSNCPDALRPLWAEKRKQYLASGRWKLTTGSNAMPMLLLHKPGSTKDAPQLRTVVDLRERNANTRKMTSQLPDIEAVLRRVASKPYRSIIDGKDVYEQIRVVPKHVPRTIFVTPDGTMLSEVMQQGDCNAGATYQSLMNHLFGPYIGVWMDVYLDDIVIYSNSAADHVEHLKIVFDVLFKEKFFLSEKKMKLFQSELKILGHVIDDHGIRMDPAKVDSVAAWKTPTDQKLLRNFLGAVGYLAPNVPHIRIPMGVLTRLTGDKVPFRWSFTEQRAFDQIKQLVSDFREHHRVSLNYSPDALPINMVTDASVSGIGGIVSQGEDWRTAPIASFYSAKLNSAQQNYAVHDVEFLAGVETMLCNRNLLQGCHFRWYTDHRALTHLLQQPRLSGRQARWLEKISDFDFEIIYISGTSNILADALSRIYSGDLPGTVRAPSEYTQYDETAVSLSSLAISAPLLTGAQELVADGVHVYAMVNAPSTNPKPRVRKVILRLPPAPPPSTAPAQTDHDRNTSDLAPNEPDFIPADAPADAIEALGAPPLPTLILTGNDNQPLPTCLKDRYQQDKFFQLVLDKPKEYKNFLVEDGLIFRREGESRILCIPDIKIDGRSARELVIEQAHSILAHLGTRKTLTYLRDQVWWKDMVRDITSYCDSCNVCKMSKPNNQHPYGLLNPLPVPPRPWDGIGMDFVGPLPESKNRHGTFDMICVIIDLLTGMTHLVPCRTDYRARQIAELVFENVYKLHGLPKYIVSDHDSWFTSIFWEHLHGLIGVKLKMSSSYHPETDGATERMNRTVTTMLRQCVSPKQTDWVQKLPAIEFAINLARSETTGYAPFFLNHGRMPRSMLWNAARANEYTAVRVFAQKLKDAVMAAHDSVLEARVKQTRQANCHRREAPFGEQDLVYVSTKNMNLPKGKARKLVPKYIGPFKINKVLGNNSFKIDLPDDLRRRGIYDVFHASLLRIHVPNDDRLFPGRDVSQVFSIVDKDEGTNTHEEWLVDRIVSHYGSRRNTMFEVRWKAGDTTWLPYDKVEHLEPLKSYFEAIGIDNINKLPDAPVPPPTDDPQVLLGAVHLGALSLVHDTRDLSALDYISTCSLSAGLAVIGYINAILRALGTYPGHILICFLVIMHFAVPLDVPLSITCPFYGDLVFDPRELHRIYEFAKRVSDGTYRSDSEMPEWYLTFVRLYNSRVPNTQDLLPSPPDFVTRQQSDLITRMTTVAINGLERTDNARQQRFEKYHRDPDQTSGDQRRTQRDGRRAVKNPYARPTKSQRDAERETQTALVSSNPPTAPVPAAAEEPNRAPQAPGIQDRSAVAGSNSSQQEKADEDKQQEHGHMEE